MAFPKRLLAAGARRAAYYEPMVKLFFEKDGEKKMRILALAIAAAFALGLPAAVPAKAEETTVVKKHRDFDNDRAKVIIKKKEEPRDKKVIIHKDY